MEVTFANMTESGCIARLANSLVKAARLCANMAAGNRFAKTARKLGPAGAASASTANKDHIAEIVSELVLADLLCAGITDRCRNVPCAKLRSEHAAFER